MSLCHESEPLNLASTLLIIYIIPLLVDAHITWFISRLDGAIKLILSKFLVIFSFINTTSILASNSPSNDYG
jgi:hypothetical protein